MIERVRKRGEEKGVCGGFHWKFRMLGWYTIHHSTTEIKPILDNPQPIFYLSLLFHGYSYI